MEAATQQPESAPNCEETVNSPLYKQLEAERDEWKAKYEALTATKSAE